MRGDHDAVRLVLAELELALEHRDDEFPRREIVIDEDDLVELRPLGLRLDLGSRFCGDFWHRNRQFRDRALPGILPRAAAIVHFDWHAGGRRAGPVFTVMWEIVGRGSTALAAEDTAVGTGIRPAF